MERERFEQIVEDYEAMIYHVMHSLGIYKNQEEFYQTGLIALWDADQRFEGEKGKFSSYAYSYIKGRMMTELTRNNRIDERNVYPDDDFWEVAVDEHDVALLEMEQLESYCKELNERQKTWVIDTFYYGLSVREIAAKEGVSESAVKKWRTAAMKKIREQLAKEKG